MKFFAFIMALIVLALSVMPCADNAEAMNNSKIKTELKTELKTASHQSNPQTDDCSPFCQCSCCAGFSITHSTSISLIISYTKKHQSSFLSSIVIGIASSIWQPPQLV